jgi:hypothetical protein
MEMIFEWTPLESLNGAVTDTNSGSVMVEKPTIHTDVIPGVPF